MIHLKAIDLKPAAREKGGFPFSLPLIQHFAELKFHSSVTFFVGENGSGKSTLLEAIAAGINLAAIGGDDLDRDTTLAQARELGKGLKYVWRQKSHRGFFLRAEDFFNYARRLQSLTKELEEIADGYSGMARGSILAQRQALIEKYGENLDANSHGESFLKLFKARFVPGGLYLLDEPEAPLSPQRQLALLFLLREMVDENAQFIIATHSPLLMAFPGAQIFSFDDHPAREIAYDDVEHVALTRAFLNNPQSFLRHL